MREWRNNGLPVGPFPQGGQLRLVIVESKKKMRPRGGSGSAAGGLGAGSPAMSSLRAYRVRTRDRAPCAQALLAGTKLDGGR